MNSSPFVPVAGIRIWDPWSRGPVGPGPRLRLSHPGRPDRKYDLTPAGSGSHALHDAPLLAGGTTGAILEIDDPSRRILPLRAVVDLQPGRLLANPLPSAPDAPEGSFAAFPDPSRLPPAGWICLRADLRRAGRDPLEPCPWALVEIRSGSQVLARGVSDAKGALVAAFPPPPPKDRPIGMDPDLPFEPREWPLEIHFGWSPARLTDSVPTLSDLASQPVVAAVSSIPGRFDAVPVRPGENILVSGTRPAPGATPADAASSFLFLQA